MDADLQDPPKVALELIEKWQQGYNVVYAQRRTRKDTFMKKFTASVFYRLLDKLAYIKIPKDTGDFRLIDKKVIDTIKKFRERNRFIRGIVSYVGFKQISVLFDRDERKAGQTNYPFTKMLKLAVDGITSFSIVFLSLIMQAGFFLICLFVLGFITEIIFKILDMKANYTVFTIINFVILMTGINGIFCGTLGMYIGRIYSEIQNRPLYIVNEVYER